MNAMGRLGLWLVSFVLSLSLFSLLMSVHGSFLFILKITTLFALPLWLLCVPFLISVDRAEGRRLWAILLAGTLSGPGYLVVFGFLMQSRGGNVSRIWQGDGLDIGIIPCLPFALAIGLATAALYVIGLRATWRRRLTKVR